MGQDMGAAQFRKRSKSTIGAHSFLFKKRCLKKSAYQLIALNLHIVLWP